MNIGIIASSIGIFCGIALLNTAETNYGRWFGIGLVLANLVLLILHGR